MPLPTLEKLKRQCRIDDDYALEDELLIQYLGASKKRAETYINRTLYENDVPKNDPDGLIITSDIELALMIAVSYFYEYRENASIPSAFYALLDPYRYINL